MVCCGHRVGVLLVVGVEGGLATHVVCCAESQITGSPPLLSDLDILREMEHEGLWQPFEHKLLPNETESQCPVVSRDREGLFNSCVYELEAPTLLCV